MKFIIFSLSCLEATYAKVLWVSTPSASLVVPIIKLVRPKQWLKNVLIFAVPILSGDILSTKIFLTTLTLFVSFSIVASSIYVLNDIRDREFDKLHPKKRNRPIASSLISLKVSKLIFFVLASTGVLISVFTFNALTTTLIFSYFIIQISYVFFLKNLPVFEMGAVASGFVMRAISGGFVNGIEVSTWFLTVVSSLALFIVSGKRLSELLNSKDDFRSRTVLKEYSANFLRLVLGSSLTSALVFYALWASETRAKDAVISAQFSTAALALILFKYANLIEKGQAEAPEEILTKERSILLLIGIWILLVAAHFFEGL